MYSFILIINVKIHHVKYPSQLSSNQPAVVKP